MPDHRKHRGPHPQDRELFAADQVGNLRHATHDLSWLLSRDYAPTSALKLVGDRFQLDSRQRIAVARCACSDQARQLRNSRELTPAEVADQVLWLDGYNVLTTIEAALSGGVLIVGRDGCYRDMASMHGSYRKVVETKPAIQIVGELAQSWNVAPCHWLLDQPVSNSGRLKTMLRETAESMGWNWDIQLVPDPDAVLKEVDGIVCTSDSQILDRAGRWFNLARVAIDTRAIDAWIVDLSDFR